MSQKVIVVGNSLAVTIPKESAKKLGIRAGDTLEFSEHPSVRAFTMRAQKDARANVNPDVIMWANAFIDKNRKLLTRLADK
ncbi:MAG TPA: AbrB/MazE/SpoVT family DNA-binding domain-containing protein [Candidatus Paceibacterota bacterium]